MLFSSTLLLFETLLRKENIQYMLAETKNTHCGLSRLYRVSEKKLMPFQIQISRISEFHYGLFPLVCIVVLFLTF